MSGRLKYSHTETRLDNESIRTNYENDLHILNSEKILCKFKNAYKKYEERGNKLIKSLRNNLKRMLKIEKCLCII